jgi:hypothetical protein
MGLKQLREWLFRLCQSRSGQCLEQQHEPQQEKNLQP